MFTSTISYGVQGGKQDVKSDVSQTNGMLKMNREHGFDWGCSIGVAVLVWCGRIPVEWEAAEQQKKT